MVRNLLDNASKYTPPAGVSTLTMTTAGGSVMLTVRDNGIGITAHSLPRVLKPFVQDAHAVTFNNRWLGLSLTVVHKFVSAHRSSGSAHSDGQGPGLGSEFTITLPLL